MIGVEKSAVSFTFRRLVIETARYPLAVFSGTRDRRGRVRSRMGTAARRKPVHEEPTRRGTWCRRSKAAAAFDGAGPCTGWPDRDGRERRLARRDDNWPDRHTDTNADVN